MPDETRHAPTLAEPLDLKSAGAAFCSRFGEPAAETHRLTVLREVLDTSRMLSRMLDEFTKAATTHYHGVHCTADMNAVMEKISRALMEWSESIVEASTAYRDWQERHTAIYRTADVRLTPSPLSFSALSMTGMRAGTPLAPPV
jgi:hypothetical protein